MTTAADRRRRAAPRRTTCASELAKLWPELQIVAVARNGVEAAARDRRAASPTSPSSTSRCPGLTGLEVAQGIEGSTRRRLRDRVRRVRGAGLRAARRSTTCSSRSRPSGWRATIERVQRELARRARHRRARRRGARERDARTCAWPRPAQLRAAPRAARCATCAPARASSRTRSTSPTCSSFAPTTSTPACRTAERAST